MGPLVTRQHRDKVASYLDSGAGPGRDGRGRRPRAPALPRESTASSSASRSSTTSRPRWTAYRDEIFGPVLTVVRVETYDEAVRLVNDNPYGNGTAIFTRDGGAARQFQFDVKVGMVGINVPDPGAGRLLQLRRLEGVALRRPPHVRPRGHPVLHAGQGRHRRAGRTRARRKVDLGFPRTR